MRRQKRRQRPTRPEGAEEAHQEIVVAHRRETTDDRPRDGQQDAFAKQEPADRPAAITDGREQAELRRSTIKVEAEQQAD